MLLQVGQVFFVRQRFEPVWNICNYEFIIATKQLWLGVVSEMFDIFVYCHPFGFWPGVTGASHCHGHDITYSSFNVNTSTFLHIACSRGTNFFTDIYVWNILWNHSVIINFVAAQFCAALFHSPIVACIVFSLDEVPHVERCSHLVSGLGSLEPMQWLLYLIIWFWLSLGKAHYQWSKAPVIQVMIKRSLLTGNRSK